MTRQLTAKTVNTLLTLLIPVPYKSINRLYIEVQKATRRNSRHWQTLRNALTPPSFSLGEQRQMQAKPTFSLLHSDNFLKLLFL